MGKLEIEMRIRFLETVLAQYNRISNNSNISIRSQSETIDNYLDELSKLYKQRDEMENEKPSATEETK
jgi:uncharacterized coiled-coil protein SlyX